MIRRVAAVPLIAASIVLSVPCRAQVRPPSAGRASRLFYIRGSVRHAEDGRALEMVKVELKRITGELAGTAFTRSNGEFEFTGLTVGSYFIVVEDKSYEPVREPVEIVNSARVGVYVFLQPPRDVRVTRPEHVVSARELAIPRKAQSAMQKGMERLYDRRDYKGSLAHFQRALEALPSYYEAHHQMGMAYMHMGDLLQAERSFRRAIELSAGRYAESHFVLAGVLSSSDRFSEAEALAHRGLELDAGAWQGHYELARALMGLNRVDAAEKSALDARARKSDFPSLHLLLANIHIRKRDYPALLEDLDHYLRLEPNGAFSAQARETRERIQRVLANGDSASPASPPKP